MKRFVTLTMTALVALLSSVWMVGADATRTVTIRGTEHFVPNTLISSDFRFSPGPLLVKSGDSVTWQNTTIDGHTISVVNQSDLPATIDDVFTCPACGPILAGHFPNGFGGPFVPALGNAATGELKAPGDSQLVGPSDSPFSSASLRITAPSGSTLYYLCAIHPWMQGSIKVS